MHDLYTEVLHSSYVYHVHLWFTWYSLILNVTYVGKHMYNVCVYVCVLRIDVSVCMHMCVCMYVCVSAWVYVCV